MENNSQKYYNNEYFSKANYLPNFRTTCQSDFSIPYKFILTPSKMLEDSFLY